MCTVTWVHDDEGYRLFCNRDELNTRTLAEPPKVFERDGVRFLAPRDPDFGGTWISVNEAGLTVCLLNGANIGGGVSAHRNSPASRGTLVMECAGCLSQDEVARGIEDLDSIARQGRNVNIGILGECAETYSSRQDESFEWSRHGWSWLGKSARVISSQRTVYALCTLRILNCSGVECILPDAFTAARFSSGDRCARPDFVS
jgi:hypothetical protein